MITVSLHCHNCRHRVTLTVHSHHSLDSHTCPNCGVQLSQTTPETLARDALVQTLNTMEEQSIPRITHKRDTKPQSSRGPGNEMLRRIGKK